MWQSFVMFVPFHFLGLRWSRGVARLLGCRIFSLAPHGTSFWQRTVFSGMKVNPILGPENEKEDSFPALRYYRLQHPQPIPETCHQLYTMFCYWCNSHSWWILDELKPQLEYHPEKETHLKGCWIRNIPRTTQPILYTLEIKWVSNTTCFYIIIEVSTVTLNQRPATFVEPSIRPWSPCLRTSVDHQENSMALGHFEGFQVFQIYMALDSTG